tara:strand:+ start:228 stop:722 length:495 start_codon:yes stop_codon:yes gene_type:complete
MEYRNARFNKGNVSIDCEINHSVHGWIPYTIDPADEDTTINNNELIELIGDDVLEWLPPTVAELLVIREDWRHHASLSRLDFAVIAAQSGWVSDAEAEDWASGAANPAIVLEVISSLPQTDQLRARIAAKAQTVVHRNDRLVLALGLVKGVTPAQFDTVFGWVD